VRNGSLQKNNTWVGGCVLVGAELQYSARVRVPDRWRYLENRITDPRCIGVLSLSKAVVTP